MFASLGKSTIRYGARRSIQHLVSLIASLSVESGVSEAHKARVASALTGRTAAWRSCTVEYKREGPGCPTGINQTRTLVGRPFRPSGRLIHGGGKSLRLVDQGVLPVG